MEGKVKEEPKEITNDSLNTITTFPQSATADVKREIKQECENQVYLNSLEPEEQQKYFNVSNSEVTISAVSVQILQI